MIRPCAALPLALFLASCGGPHPDSSGSQSLGSVQVNARLCRYYAADRRVEFVWVFDTGELHIGGGSGGGLKSGRGRPDEMEDRFRTLEGHSFAVRYRSPGPVEVDGREYQPVAGRVFLVRLARGGNVVEQLSLDIPPREADVPDDTYVRDMLLKAATQQPRLAEFIGGEGR